MRKDFLEQVSLDHLNTCKLAHLKDTFLSIFRPLTNDQRRPLLGYGMTAMSSLANACVILLGKWVMTAGDPIFYGGLVLVIAGLILLAGAAVKDGIGWMFKMSRKAWKFTTIYTLISISALGCFWLGISMVDAAKVGFIGRFQVVVIVILGAALLKEKFHKREVFAALVVFTGMFILYHTFPAKMSLGFWIMLGSAVSFGLVEITAKVTVKYCEPYHFNTIRNLFSGAVLLLIGWARGKADFNLGAVWWGVIAMAMLGPVFSRVFYLYALRHAEVSKTALITQIQPVFVVLLAMLFRNEYPSAQELIGGAVIIAGCALVILLHPENTKKLSQIYRYFQ